MITTQTKPSSIFGLTGLFSFLGLLTTLAARAWLTALGLEAAMAGTAWLEAALGMLTGLGMGKKKNPQRQNSGGGWWLDKITHFCLFGSSFVRNESILHMPVRSMTLICSSSKFDQNS